MAHNVYYVYLQNIVAFCGQASLVGNFDALWLDHHDTERLMRAADWSKWTFGKTSLITPNRIEWTASELEARAFNHAQNINDLSGPWAGWKTRGQWLITPDRKRVNTQRLRMWMNTGGYCDSCKYVERIVEALQMDLFDDDQPEVKIIGETCRR